ncbi:hypothetical protein GCK32_009842 [Trichostrongylus colubriformis]|uniref:Alpha-D-phosphohexomutase alpha/beta/alpha domain-containing protein n=1 Tax=Trichostrongylus colubriformis TaxID=6319 RepID=A0AAN8G3G0_TRICO
MIRMRTLVVPSDQQAPLEKQIVIRNVTKRDWVVKLRSEAPKAMRFDFDKIVIDSRKYVIIKLTFNLKELSSYKTGVSSKIFLFARPLMKFNEECLKIWLQRENNELACQLAHVVQLVVSDNVFSAEKLVLDLPGYATAIDPIPFAIEEEELDSRCETAANIEDDTDTARVIDDKLLAHARLIASRKLNMSPEDQEKLMAKVKNWLAWDKNKKTREEIDALAKQNDIEALAARMNARLLFGTAGIRARMEAGFGRLNDLTIITVTNGFAKYLLTDLMKNPLLKSADTSIDPYFEIERSTLCYHKKVNEATPLKITYSAFHGVGYRYAKRMFKEFGFPEDHIISVQEQQEADPTFPTVPFPNPEEGAKVLALSFKTAEAYNSSFIIANDPDADRVQIAERKPEYVI